jgi:hypothetical protein
MYSNLTRISAGSQRWGRVPLHIVEERVPVRAASSAAGFLPVPRSARAVRTNQPAGAFPVPTTISLPDVSCIVNLRRKGSTACYGAGGIRSSSSPNYADQAVLSGKSPGINSTQPVFHTCYHCSSGNHYVACRTISEPRYLSLDPKQQPTCAISHLNGWNYTLDAVSVTTGKLVSGSTAASVKGAREWKLTILE